MSWPAVRAAHAIVLPKAAQQRRTQALPVKAQVLPRKLLVLCRHGRALYMRTG